ncbi:MAG: hypothetical protein JW822_09180 [Spirochaetales bacterium]|nr:hypothetical protein [Spirochaetales bacterium]
MKNRSCFIIIACVVICVFCAGYLFASEKSEAQALMKQCDDGVKLIDVPLKNFGDSNDLAKFEEGLNIIKMGKAKIAQAKYADAKAKFNQYLAIQTDLYKSLAEKYIKRTQDLIDEISVELAEFVSDSYVLEAFTKANHYLDSARTQVKQKKYSEAVANCKRAKKFLFDIYEKMLSELPDKYKKDSADIKNEIFQS